MIAIHPTAIFTYGIESTKLLRINHPHEKYLNQWNFEWIVCQIILHEYFHTTLIIMKKWNSVSFRHEEESTSEILNDKIYHLWKKNSLSNQCQGKSSWILAPIQTSPLEIPEISKRVATLDCVSSSWMTTSWPLPLEHSKAASAQLQVSPDETVKQCVLVVTPVQSSDLIRTGIYNILMCKWEFINLVVMLGRGSGMPRDFVHWIL